MTARLFLYLASLNLKWLSEVLSSKYGMIDVLNDLKPYNNKCCP